MKASESRMRGFTLLEMLVVLLIAGMALALTSQALGQYQRAHARVSAATQAGREYRLAENWFRDSINGLYAAADPDAPSVKASFQQNRATQPDDVPVFHGDAHGFSGITLAPILAGQGIPTLQTWSLIPGNPGNEALALLEDGKQLRLAFPGAGRLALHYLDEDGEPHPQWPPAQGQWPQLPSAIALELGSGAVIVAAVAGPKNPRIIPYEPEPF